MLERLKVMLGFKTGGYSQERPKPDLITGQLTIATQRNIAAGETARQVLREVLERNDSLKGYGQ